MEKTKLKKIIPKWKIKVKVRQLGKRITRDYKDKNPILVGIMKGSFVFLSDLIREIKIPHEVDFISVVSYGSEKKASGVVRLLKDLSSNIEKRHVIIVEDIVDTGLTLNYIRENLLTRKPASVKVCALLSKEARREVAVSPDYVGAVVPDEFVVGYGLDFAQMYRCLPVVGVLAQEAAARARGRAQPGDERVPEHADGDSGQESA